ncbi:hypothetical protein JTE90_004169 [Oedothorax gibbosus]|uniref:Uncharacterized protein n=1 Tax=Oedothorax gibbosus TaxID=931172 RepID=A0AAV6TU36_9ARAC|nr:hypothetical protein JTE90_004169 [Oedothorax gibbosus]
MGPSPFKFNQICLSRIATENTPSSLFLFFSRLFPVAEACEFHLSTLQMKEDYNEMEMANNRLNPINNTVYHWHNKWRLLNLGPRSAIGLIEKLKEGKNRHICEEKGITHLLWSF